MSVLSEWLPLWGLAAVGGALAGLCTSFVVINLGLRLMAAGQAFLDEARKEGRLFAHPGPDSPAEVRWIFRFAILASVIAGIIAFFDLLVRLEPVIWPTGRAFAELR